MGQHHPGARAGARACMRARARGKMFPEIPLYPWRGGLKGIRERYTKDLRRPPVPF